ncbi:hypothetical protein I6I86_05830 [Moraxella osloensis]|nr:hypothetical protein [Moraxella osloensis]MBL7667463.1 hypothetical protein [Moraxella osloensis]
MNDNFQTSTNAPSNIATTALNVVLVIIETLLTLLLRFDADLRKTVYPLATTNTVVRIHAYVPSVTFYMTFTVNGILLDSQLQPSQQVDVTINGFTWQIAQNLFTNQPKAIEQLQIRGEAQKTEEVKAFLHQIGINQLLQVITKAVKGDKDKQKTKKPTKTDADYKQQVETLNSQVNAANLQKTALEAQIVELKSKNQWMKRAAIAFFVLFVICAIGWAVK